MHETPQTEPEARDLRVAADPSDVLWVSRLEPVRHWKRFFRWLEAREAQEREEPPPPMDKG